MNLTTNLTITALYASLLALLFIALSVNIIRLRFKLKVGVGDGGESTLTKAIRVHGNFSEYIPLALFLLGSYELSGANTLWVHIAGATLFVGRIFHALGLSKSIGTSAPRAVGTVATFLILLMLAVENIRLFLLA
ncbi:MAPEG family protein [Colwellia sp. KU-HH00111]|uniref:MAPEG family protein n=1 Tax=Colwellia sp. KU-HH00111 TaxID=3127652 RepID=UPI00310B5C4D